jgi:uncharacterized protein (DUF1501 family)
MSDHTFHPDRRELLRFGGAAASLAALTRLGIGQPQSGPNRKTLVCVLLAGGNDGHNLIVPRSNAEYAAYAAARQNLAIPQGDLLSITPATPDGAQYGLHPSVPELQSLFGSGKLAVVPNVGTLIEPVTKFEVQTNAKPLPPQLFSHNDQQRQWELPAADAASGPGWGGLIADDLAPIYNAASPTLSSITLGGSTPLLVGVDTAPYALGVAGAEGLVGFDDSLGMIRKPVFDAIVQASQGNALAREFGRMQEEAQQLAAQVSGALDMAPTFTTSFDPASYLASQLHMVARMIAVQDLLGVSRQFFLTLKGGFDTHDDHALVQPGLFGDISQSLASFQAAIEEIGKQDEVVLFTISDFGRTLSSNGDGTDHAWGAPHLVLSSSVTGGDIHGTFPNLAIDSADDIGGGRLVPTASADQYAATLAQWFGVTDPGDLAAMFPNLANFAASDLGFL